jgi:putative DNA primase/helicase
MAINLATGESRPATRDDRFLKTAGCRPEQMPTPVFDKFMEWATMAHPELAAWIMRFLGYSLTGLTTYEIFANFIGTGRNGKGTLLHLMEYIMGDYQVELPLSAIVLEPHENRRAFDFADLPGRRMAKISDAPKNTRYNSANIKKLTGNDKHGAGHEGSHPHYPV